MVAILPTDRYEDWIGGSGAVADFMLPFDANQLQAKPETSRKGDAAVISAHPSLL
jgi:hypothetical protein